MKIQADLLKQLFLAEGWDLQDNGDFTYNVYCEVGCEAEDLVALEVPIAHAHFEYLLVTGMIDDEQYDQLVK